MAYLINNANVNIVKMAEFTLAVQYITSKSCFCYLSEEFAKYAQERNVVRALIGEKIVYFSIGGLLPAPHTNVFGINPLYAKSLQLSENNPILVRFVPNTLPVITSVTVSPLNRNDYEVLELLANLVEETLLQQIKIVNKGQDFVIWISNYSALTVRIDDASPASVGWLDFLTEFHINQPAFNDNKKSINNKTNSSHSNLFEKYKNQNLGKHNFTIYPVQRLKQKLVYKFEYPFVVFIQRKYLPVGFNDKDNFIACLCDVKNFEFLVCVQVVDDDVFTTNFRKTLYVNDALFKISSLRISSKVSLRLIEELPTVKTIKLVSNQADEQLINKFKSYFNDLLREQKCVVLNSNFSLQLSKNLTVKLEFEEKFCVVDGDFFQNCQYTVDVSEDVNSGYNHDNQCVDYYKDINETVEKDILLAVELNLRFDSNENVLIVGKRGTGKTALLQRIEQKLSEPQYKIHTERVNCKTIKGKSGESLQRYLFPMIVKLIYYQPSVLIFDDFDVICAKTFSPEPPTPESLYYDRIAEMLEGVLQNDLKNNKIMVIAATESGDLNEKLFTSRGKHYFKHVYNTTDLDKGLRKGLLEYLFKDKSFSDDVDFDGLSTKTEGFVLQDLVDLANRAIFESYRTAGLAEDFTAQKACTITVEHCNTALQTVSDISLQNVNLFSPGERDFSDIGGLEDVKATLIESLVWPLQYPNLFGNAPLRLQSGLLLYGLPGTGKTILAAAAAKQCGLRLISIKGPELLSKYIGASEQAVRDVFEKAQRAKPCILFFDEFDSLAPRRGHDNTGVTDRVVNQFLTQLDGIESLSGVCVLAATSRPDLLDPALLRPGRLDKQILCSLPDRAARLDILKALSKNMSLGDGVDLGVVAAGSEGFSGADLQAVVSTAQLASLEHLLHSEEKCVENVAVQQSHLVKALKETRPSLSVEERGKYERIYRNFKYGSMEQVKPGQKATLA